MTKKSKELTNLETKIKYIIKDGKELYETIKKLLISGWSIGFDVAKLVIQVISIWEVIPKLPEVLKIGKYINIVISFIKKFKLFR